MTYAAADVSAIIVAYDSAAVLGDCLESIAIENVATVLVDNASQDRSAEIGERYGARVIRNARNEGFGRGMNIGVDAVRTPFVLLANPDINLERGAVQRLLEAALNYPEAAILAPRIVEPNGDMFFANRSLLSPYLKNSKGRKWVIEGDCCAPFLSGACLLVRRDVFQQIGGFDEDIFLFYEDDDLCRRVVERGHSLVHVHAAIARHKRGASSAPAPGRIFKARFHLAWSRLYVARKWGIDENIWPRLLIAACKWLGSCLLLNRKRRERYGGTIAGFLAFRTGLRATQREGLD